MAGSHEVRGSLPLCSTTLNTATHSGGRFFMPEEGEYSKTTRIGQIYASYKEFCSSTTPCMHDTCHLC